MLVWNTPIMSDSLPCFMSGYDGDDPTTVAQDLHHVDGPSPKPDQVGATAAAATNFLAHAALTSHLPPRPTGRRGSATSALSDSTESSPTTTSSTFDSPLAPGMSTSPSSSPESASSAIPPKSFQSPLPEPTARAPSRRPPSPRDEARKNIKGLTLDMTIPSVMLSTQMGTAADPTPPFSAPTSPLREPLRTGRKKPTNLTIRTPAFNQMTFGRAAGDVPPTPSQQLAGAPPLCSPRLPGLAGAGARACGSPVNGVHLTLPNIAQHVHADSISSHSGSSAGSATLPNLREEDYQPPASQEVKERGYTDGPVMIYDAGVYLYLEPTPDEARRFDTVINVAKEVNVPFGDQPSDHATVVSLWRHTGARPSIPEPPTAMSAISFKSAFEWPSRTPTTGPVGGSPSTPTAAATTTTTTPRPVSSADRHHPEYLHVPWDHNSEILDDLYPLCQLIDARVQQGRKVLVHCQLGVSRSASLIIAYGLYKQYEKDFHSMYMTVKGRSRWVGPNMSLIYQLTDFNSKCRRGYYAQHHPVAPSAWWVSGSDTARTPVAAPTLSPAPAPSPATVPVEKPPLRLDKALPAVPPPAAPPAAPSASASRPGGAAPAPPPAPTTSTHPAPAPRPLPFRQKFRAFTPMAIPPHRPVHLPGLTFTQPASLMDLATPDEPSTPSIFSPRAAEFRAAPFGITAAGDLVSSAPRARARPRRPPPGAFPGGDEWRHSLRQSLDLSHELDKLLALDPRSPPHKGDPRETVRSIDDVL